MKNALIGLVGFGFIACGGTSVEETAERHHMDKMDAGSDAVVVEPQPEVIVHVDAGEQSPTLVDEEPEPVAVAPIVVEDAGAEFVEEIDLLVEDAGAEPVIIREPEQAPVVQEDAGAEPIIIEPEETPVIVTHEDAGTDEVVEPELLEKLVLTLAEDTPASRIVLSGTEELFTKYTLSNPNAHDVGIGMLMIGNQSEEGSIADFTALRVTDCVEGGWEYRFQVCEDDPSCFFWVTDPENPPYASNITFLQEDEALQVPAESSVSVCVYGTLADVFPSTTEEAFREPRSGDRPNLEIVGMVTSDADSVQIDESAYNPPTMTLRKAMPEITALPVINVSGLVASTYTSVFNFQVTAVGGPISLAQVQFNVQASEEVSWMGLLSQNGVSEVTAVGSWIDPGTGETLEANCYDDQGAYCRKGSAVRQWYFAEELVIEKDESVMITFTMKVLDGPSGERVVTSFVAPNGQHMTAPAEALFCESGLGSGYDLPSREGLMPFLIWSDRSELPHSLKTRCSEESFSSTDWIGDALLPTLEPVSIGIL